MPTLSERFLRRLGRMLIAFERGELTPPPKGRPPHKGESPRPRIVMALDDCPSGARVDCGVLVEIASTETQLVEICGTPTGGTFKLTFDGQTSEEIAYNATAAQLQTALENLSNINAGDVVVEIGPGASLGSSKIYRWLIHFTGQFAGEDVPELIAQSAVDGENYLGEDITLEVEVASQPDLEDTGETLPVKCAIPLPPGQMIHAGSIGLAVHVPTHRYCFAAVECRDCESY